MSITLSPAKAAYLSRVAEGLSDLLVEDREEVIQDLEAHLAELEDDSLEQVLGTPEAFVDEFRQSAGLASPKQASRSRRARAREDLHVLAARLSEVTHWPTIRPVWVWTRGWLLVCAWSLLYDYEGFSRFPIPSVGQSTAVGLMMVIAATALSVWLDSGTSGPRWRAVGSAVYSAVSALALIGLLLNPQPTYSELVHQYEEQMFLGQMTSADGEPISNVYAYDLDGNALEVLLFDQDGRPLLTLPSHVYQEAEGMGTEASYYDGGTVAFQRDTFGRIIPNLYPLELSRYDEYGNLEPMPPPLLGFPSTVDGGDVPSVPTTIGYVR